MPTVHNGTRRFVYNDGGRAAAGFKGETGDCACRAIAIATGKPYREVHDGLNALCALLGEPLNTLWIVQGRQRQRASAEIGIPPPITHLYLGQLGWCWTSTNAARLHRCDLPSGRLVVKLTQHLVALIDNVVHDHGEYWRGRRTVYGYYTQNS
jgi:hypothetical protein